MTLKTAYENYRVVSAKFPGTAFAGQLEVAAALESLLVAVADQLGTPERPTPRSVIYAVDDAAS